MPVKLLAASAFVLAMGVATANAQSRLAGHTPAEQPPAGFTGNQYVDSRGCAFIRAGFDGTVTWVPRLADNRRPMCGLPPSIAVRTAAAPAASTPRSAPAQAPQPATAAAVRPDGAHPSCPDNAPFGQPIVREDGSRAIRCTAQPAPAAAAVPRPVQTAAVAARPEGAHPSCPDQAPYGQPFERADGSRAIRCTAQPAPAAAAVPRPVQTAAAAVRPDGAHPSCPDHAPYGQPVRRADGSPAIRCTATPAPVAAPVAPARPAAPVAVASIAADAAACLPVRPRSQQGVGHVASRPDAVPVCPPVATSARIGQPHSAPATAAQGGATAYVPVWQDGRLNPYRAVGTAQGEAAMNRVWSQTVPREPLAGSTAPTPVRSAPAPAQQPPAQAVGHFVQVGSFGVPANASQVVARLEARGLPVQITRIRRSGRVLEVVLAGPFASQAASAQALATVRGLGYRDAFALAPAR